MVAIDPLVATTLLILASSGAPACPVAPASKLNIVPSAKEVKYDTKQSLKKLQEYSMDTVDPYGFHGTTITQAFMSGRILPSYNIKIKNVYSPKYDAYCLWYEDITVKLEIDPTIVIAKELNENMCMRKSLIEHELKHVKADRIVVNKYAKSIGKKLYDELNSRGYSAGPIPAAYAKETAEKMQKIVGQILEFEFRKLELERMEMQRSIDSLGEYNRVNELCPTFDKQREKLYTDLGR